MKDKSIITLIETLIKSPPMALIIIGVLLAFVSAVGGIQGYRITDLSWRLGLAGIGIVLILSGLFFLRKTAISQQKAEFKPEEAVASPTTATEKVITLPPEVDLVARVAQVVLTLTEGYLEGVRQALFPNDLQDFLDQKSLPSVDRHLEWWEKAITMGEGPRGLPLTFLDQEKAIRLFKLSSQISYIAQDSKQVTQIIVLGEAIYSQSAGYHTGGEGGQRKYRQTHLRDHIRKMINLNHKASKCNTIPKVREMLPR